jgi:hypothetical protein
MLWLWQGLYHDILSILLLILFASLFSPLFKDITSQCSDVNDPSGPRKPHATMSLDPAILTAALGNNFTVFLNHIS